MFICSHTSLHSAIQLLPFLTVGTVLREYLIEDLATVVEDFLFTRDFASPYVNAMDKCCLEDDFDCVAFSFLSSFLGYFTHSVHIYMEQYIFRYAKHIHMLRVALRFGQPVTCSW